MPRKGPAPKRPVIIDPVYNSPLVTSIADPETTQSFDLGYRYQGGKVLVSEDEQIKRLSAARFQLDIMGVAGIIVHSWIPPRRGQPC